MSDRATDEAFATIARRWVGTAYRHQASVEGVGADCLGLFRGVWREVFGREPAEIPAYTPSWSVGSGEDRLLNAAGRIMEQTSFDPAAQGRVVLFRMRPNAVSRHLGIITSTGSRNLLFTHTYSLHGVVENVFTPAWQQRVTGCFAIPPRSSTWPH